jgi:hypothetical protein
MWTSIGRGTVLLLAIASISSASGAPPIAGGDFPGRERYRFVDPPVARAMQQTAPNPLLLGDRRPTYRTCPGHRALRGAALHVMHVVAGTDMRFAPSCVY